MIFHPVFTAQPAVSTPGTHSTVDYKTDVKKEQDDAQYAQDLGKFLLEIKNSKLFKMASISCSYLFSGYDIQRKATQARQNPPTQTLNPAPGLYMFK